LSSLIPKKAYKTLQHNIEVEKHFLFIHLLEQILRPGKKSREKTIKVDIAGVRIT